ncbi:MAG: HAD-IA family hydrolase [Thermoleophilia bacterium]
MPSAELRAISVDAFGTLVTLSSPTERLREALARHGVARDHDAVGEAFLAEARYYRPRSLQGTDGASLHALRVACVGVFLEHLAAPVAPDDFVDDFIGALDFGLTDGAEDALDQLAAAGLALVCTANWDVGLHGILDRLGVSSRFAAIVTSADAGVEKPDPAIFHLALSHVDVEPAHALHIGDEEVDRLGAAAAGLAFAEVPLATLPARLGLGGAR